MSKPIVLHMRAEAYPMGSRALITPETAAALINDNFIVHVESSKLRCFPDEAYKKAGAKIVPADSWVTAPQDHIIIGIKQVGDANFPIAQTHIAAAHYYKQQEGWIEGLSRYARGGGTLLDIGWIKAVTGENFTTFETHTGLAAAGLGAKLWLHQLQHPEGSEMAALPRYRAETLVQEGRAALAEGEKISGRAPRAIVIGANGRTGTATIDSLLKLGLKSSQIERWGRKETTDDAADEKILKADMVFNCAFIGGAVRPFVTDQSVKQAGSRRQLTTIVDVSCDSYGPHHPLPVYRGNTTPDKPSRVVKVSQGPPLSVVAIGYLPSILPIEATEKASRQFLPVFQSLRAWKQSRVWSRLEKLFNEKVATLPTTALRSKI